LVELSVQINLLLTKTSKKGYFAYAGFKTSALDNILLFPLKYIFKLHIFLPNTNINNG